MRPDGANDLVADLETAAFDAAGHDAPVVEFVHRLNREAQILVVVPQRCAKLSMAVRTVAP